VTGSQPGEMEVAVGSRGVDRWFVKPIRPEELVEALNEELLRATSLS
jgi:DNA-binding response OmpR family regulator